MLLIYVGISCKENKPDFQNSNGNSKSQTKLDSGCSLTTKLSNSISEIKKNPSKFNSDYGMDDNCYLAFLDTLTRLFIISSDTQYIECLNLLAKISDGYVSDYFTIQILPKLTENNFESYCKYIISTRKMDKDALSKYFVESIVNKIEDTKETDRKKKRKDIETLLRNQIKSIELNKEEDLYLKEIFKEVDKSLRN